MRNLVARELTTSEAEPTTASPTWPGDTNAPSPAPTEAPFTQGPSPAASPTPSDQPPSPFATGAPITDAPTEWWQRDQPTAEPTPGRVFTETPSVEPSADSPRTHRPSKTLTEAPSEDATDAPSPSEESDSTHHPTHRPTHRPSRRTRSPSTARPSHRPTQPPFRRRVSGQPSAVPTLAPTETPSPAPTNATSEPDRSAAGALPAANRGSHSARRPTRRTPKPARDDRILVPPVLPSTDGACARYARHEPPDG
jgi:hypothetical protein